jgi:hypothetical protein
MSSQVYLQLYREDLLLLEGIAIFRSPSMIRSENVTASLEYSLTSGSHNIYGYYTSFAKYPKLFGASCVQGKVVL